MRTFTALIVALFMAGCAQTEYMAYEGNDAVQVGTGGAKTVVDGIDFWMSGTPPRKYRVIGVVNAKTGESRFSDNYIRDGVSSEVKQKGGDAAILVASDSGGMWSVGKSRVLQQFYIVKYVN